MIVLVGSRGNMGKRYSAILKYLGIPFVPVEIEHNDHYVSAQVAASRGVIIATPTDTHAAIIRRFLRHGKPILCEKPVTKNVAELKELLKEIAASKTPFRMVYQYSMLIDRNRIGRSHYDYFRHGGDGLTWDCLQIVGLSRGELTLREESPVWTCMINGKALSLRHMDAAYIGYVQRWLLTPSQDLGEILAAHEKTEGLVPKYG